MWTVRVSSMGCYAFKDASREETLTQHVLGIIECYDKMWEFKGFKQKISRIYGVNEPIVSDMIFLAAIMHDLGKTKKELQDKCNEECTSFRQHYITSAQLALKLGYEVPELGLSPDSIEGRLKKLFNNSELKSLDYGDTYLLIVVLPALLHHYAQVTDETSILGGLDSTETSLEIHKDCITELTTIISEASKSIKSEIGRKIIDKLKNIVLRGYTELSIINSRIFRDVESYEYIPGRFIAEVATGLLNLCDSRVASNNRQCVNQHISKEQTANQGRES